MDLYSNRMYMEDVLYVANLDLPWEKLENSSLMLSGATGLIGSFLVDVILEKNNRDNLNCKVFALGRSEERVKERFSKYTEDDNLRFIRYDVNEPLVYEEIEKIDYILHLASNTHPLQYSTDPIGTITTNIIGVQNMLDYAVSHRATRFAFASSNEIYGENRGDVEFFDEKYCGYIDCNTMRAGYPESKRCGEALCQAYKAQKGLDIVIPRLTRTYGPTMLMTDSKAISQFIKKGISGEDIVLKSEGNQFYSYQYVADSVSGLLTVLLSGLNGEAYNISDERSDITLRELSEAIANYKGKKVVYEIPDKVEASGYSKATKARLAGDKLKSLGWTSKYDIKQGIKRTMDMLSSI